MEKNRLHNSEKSQSGISYQSEEDVVQAFFTTAPSLR